MSSKHSSISAGVQKCKTFQNIFFKEKRTYSKEMLHISIHQKYGVDHILGEIHQIIKI